MSVSAPHAKQTDKFSRTGWCAVHAAKQDAQIQRRALRIGNGLKSAEAVFTVCAPSMIARPVHRTVTPLPR
jgi:hypothetical protein